MLNQNAVYNKIKIKIEAHKILGKTVKFNLKLFLIDVN